MCWKRAAAASIPLSIHQHAIRVMSRAAKRSLNQSPLRMMSSRRWSGTWKSSSSKASLKGVGPWPRLMLRRIFCKGVGQEGCLVQEFLGVPVRLCKNNSCVSGILHVSWMLQLIVGVLW